jgi:hypothetical protein
VTDDPPPHRIYTRLLQCQAKAADLYECIRDDSGRYAMFTLKSTSSENT